MDLEKERINKTSNRRIIYANDILLLTKREAELKEIIKRFRKFLKRKDLSLSFEKSKIMVFEKKEKNKDRTRNENRNGTLSIYKDFEEMLLVREVEAKRVRLGTFLKDSVHCGGEKHFHHIWRNAIR